MIPLRTMSTRVSLDEIIVRPEHHVRMAKPHTVGRYAEMEVYERAPVELIRCSDDNNRLHLAQGNNRIAAARRNGVADVPAEIRDGTTADVRHQAIVGNLAHGEPLTSDELEKAVRTFVKLHPDWSLTKLSNEMGVGRGFIDKLLAADRARENIGPTVLPKSVLVEISRFPDEMQKRVAQAAERNVWTSERVRVIQIAFKAGRLMESVAEEIGAENVETVKENVPHGPALREREVREADLVGPFVRMREVLRSIKERQERGGTLDALSVPEIEILTEDLTEVREISGELLEYLNTTYDAVPS